jgi:deoxyribodipyrimidine photolyase-related protein
MSGALRFVLGDQLTRDVSALQGLDAGRDVVLMVEVVDEATYARHHKQKIAFIFSAMRHFAQDLRAQGVRVDYVRLDDSQNTGSFGGELARALARHAPDQVIVTEPGEWRVWQMMLDWRETLAVPLDIRPDTRFFATREAFAAFARGRKHYRMEFFYREMRRQTGLLMENGKPVGGAWNFDVENRKALPKNYVAPVRPVFAPDTITREVMALVADRFADHFGDLESFNWPVTRQDALRALDAFIAHALPGFGDVQDAMKADEDFLNHALLSPCLNAGLLTAGEVCAKAEAAWRSGHAPLNAVEGFIRQVLGWREFVRGLYWHEMPGYAETNFLDATRSLPAFYWTGETDMRCLALAVQATRRNAYAHHIQRLMVLGNFALLAGIAPAEIEAWFLVVYADAYEWVELPNVHGMAIFADGGVMASKPYAASGAYIDRMSDYCTGCRYDPKAKSGPDACPFNALYWAFLIRNEEKLGNNPRMAMPYRTLRHFSPERRAAIMADSERVLDAMNECRERI